MGARSKADDASALEARIWGACVGEGVPDRGVRG